VGGTRERHFAGISFKLRKLFKNAPTPTTSAPAYFAGVRVHAVLGNRPRPQDALATRSYYLYLDRFLNMTKSLAKKTKFGNRKRKS
jgi:hypothetical protein